MRTVSGFWYYSLPQQKKSANRKSQLPCSFCRYLKQWLGVVCRIGSQLPLCDGPGLCSCKASKFALLFWSGMLVISHSWALASIGWLCVCCVVPCFVRGRGLLLLVTTYWVRACHCCNKVDASISDVLLRLRLETRWTERYLYFGRAQLYCLGHVSLLSCFW